MVEWDAYLKMLGPAFETVYFRGSANNSSKRIRNNDIFVPIHHKVI